MWEYECPRCKAPLGYEATDFCVECGATFSDVEARIPPRFLENYEAMTEYAHKCLIPRLSPELRDLLVQYFTEYFNNGFEEGNFSAWTGTYVDTGNTLEVIAAAQHHGNYGAHSILTAFTNLALCYKQLASAYSTVFAHLYIKFNTAFNLGSGYYVTYNRLNYGDNEIASIGIRNDGGTYKWQLRYLSSGTTYSYQVLESPLPTTGVWYCIELKVVVHASAGEARFYLDGTEKLTATGLDDDNYGNVSRIWAGQNVPAGAFGSHDIYYDCVVVGDVYIGPEEEVTYKTVSDSGLGSDSIGIGVAVPISDSGLGSDAIGIEAQIPISESGLGADSVGVQAQIPISDAGVGADSVAVQTEGQVQVSDLGAGVDSIELEARVPVGDSGLGSDEVAIEAQVPIADLGAGMDSITVQQIIPKEVSDAGVGSDAIGIEGQIPVSDGGVGADSIMIKTEIPISDVGFGVDTIQILTQVMIADQGTGVDIVSVQVGVWIGIIKSSLSMLERGMKMEFAKKEVDVIE